MLTTGPPTSAERRAARATEVMHHGVVSLPAKATLADAAAAIATTRSTP